MNKSWDEGQENTNRKIIETMKIEFGKEVKILKKTQTKIKPPYECF